MEIVRKKISLDKCKTRVNCALPYIPYNEPFVWIYPSGDTEEMSGNTTFGNFVSDINYGEELYDRILSATNSSITVNDEFIRTRTLFHRYNQLLEILRNGLHLKHIKDQLCINGVVYSDTYIENFEYDGTTYEFLRESKVVGMYDESGETQFNYIENGVYVSNLEIDSDYVIVLDDFDEFQELGGKDLINIVDEIIVSGTTIESAITPYVPIHVLLTCDEDDLGVMTPYMDENGYTPVDRKTYESLEPGIPYENYETHVRQNQDFDYKGNVTGLTPHRVTSDTIQVESKLQTLKCKKYAVTDNGVILNGCLSDADIRNLIEHRTTEVHLELPFEIGVVVNKDSSNSVYTGDYISEINEIPSVSSITFVYCIGRRFTNSNYDITTSSGGVEYKETYQFKAESGITESDSIYGVPNVKYHYKDIKYDESKVTAYNEDFNLYRDVNIGNITEFNAADVWTSGSAINTPLFKEEYLMGASSDANIDLNVVIERGAATAFEKHLILGECNTYDDLVNYRNGMFLEK